MCVICIKHRGVQFPTIETVEQMCDTNPHGFSLVIRGKSGKPRIYKTLKQSEFLALYRNILKEYDYQDTTMFIHARIKTHGTMRIENCHGWRANGIVFAHNGILSIKNRGDMTDSETFFRDIFIPAYQVGRWKAAELTIKAVIGTSKFVFMESNGDLKHYGNYINDNGLLYSNDSYKPRVYPKWCGSGYLRSGYPVSGKRVTTCDSSWIDEYYNSIGYNYEK